MLVTECAAAACNQNCRLLLKDVDKCIAIMRELENVEMTANLLLKNSDIVTTVRRVNISLLICSTADVGVIIT